MINSQTILFIKANHISIGFFPIMVFNIGESQGSKESESLRWKSWLINETIVCPCSSVLKFNLVFGCVFAVDACEKQQKSSQPMTFSLLDSPSSTAESKTFLQGILANRNYNACMYILHVLQ